MFVKKRGEGYTGVVLFNWLYVGWQRSNCFASRRFIWTRLSRVNNHLWVGPLYFVWGRFI